MFWKNIKLSQSFKTAITAAALGSGLVMFSSPAASQWTCDLNGTDGGVNANPADGGASASSSQSLACGEGAVAGFGSTVIGTLGKGDGSFAVAIGVATNFGNPAGENSVAVGTGADAEGESAISIGASADASGEGSIAMGRQALARALDVVSIGYLSNFYGGPDNVFVVGGGGVRGTAVGAFSDSAGESSVAFGYDADATGLGSSAVGMDAKATGNFSTAIGLGAIATSTNSVALGTGSVADQADTVSVGAAGSERRIVNVAAGTAATDAVNVSQLNAVTAGASTAITNLQTSVTANTSAITNVQAGLAATNSALAAAEDRLDALEAITANLDERFDDAADRSDAGTATAVALSGAMFLPGKSFNLTGNIGAYRGAVAGALQLGALVSQSVALNAGVAHGFNKGGKTALRAGFSFGW